MMLYPVQNLYFTIVLKPAFSIKILDYKPEILVEFIFIEPTGIFYFAEDI